MKIMKSKEKENRWVWLDFIRIVAINMVVFYHTVEAVLQYRIKGNHRYELDGIRTYLHSFGLPLFFVVSGMAKGLKTKRYTINFLRIYYLLILTILSVILFLIPATFIRLNIVHNDKDMSLRKITNECDLYHDRYVYIGEDLRIISFTEFMFSYFWQRCFIHIGLDWLWFMPILIIIELLTYPFIKLIEMLSNKIDVHNHQQLYMRIISMVSIIDISFFVYYVILRNDKQPMFGIIIIVMHIMLFIGIKLYYQSNINVTFFKFVIFICLLVVNIPVCMVLIMSTLNVTQFEHDVLSFNEQEQAFRKAFDYDIAYTYYWLYHLFGFLFTKIICIESMTKLNAYFGWFKMFSYQIGVVLLFMAITTDLSRDEYNQPFSYINIGREPDFYQRSMYIVAGWTWIYVMCLCAYCVVDDKYGMKLKMIYKASLIVYFCHGLFVKIVPSYWYNGIYEHEEIENRSDIWIMFIATICLSYLVAFLVLYIKSIAKCLSK